MKSATVETWTADATFTSTCAESKISAVAETDFEREFLDRLEPVDLALSL